MALAHGLTSRPGPEDSCRIPSAIDRVPIDTVEHRIALKAVAGEAAAQAGYRKKDHSGRDANLKFWLQEIP